MMRTRTLSFFAFLALCLLFSGVALSQGTPREARPTPTPAPLPADWEPAPTSPEALPDLIVESIVLSPPEPLVGQDVTVRVTIKNIGTEDVEPGDNFYLDFYINPLSDELRGIPGDIWWGVQGYLMQAGATATFSRTLTGVFTDTAAYNLWAQVDTPDLPPPNPLGWVVESNEDNNVMGPKYVTAHTRFAWVQKDHLDFFRNMASTLDVVPITGTVGIITGTPAVDLQGDSALALGIFDEPPKTSWGLSPTLPLTQMLDYNMIHPDARLNVTTTHDQRFASVHAQGGLVISVWEDGRNGPTYGRDVFLRWSSDEGETWLPDAGGIQVNETFDDHSRNDQKHPTVAVAPDGTIVVAWQDHRDASFDIYVQVFRYAGGSLIRCDPDGDCAAACDPSAEVCNFRVDTDANDLDQVSPDIAVDENNNFYIAWQDQRNNNDDIFAVRSYTSTVECPATRGSQGWLPERSTQVPLAPDQLYLCWGDDTRIDDDPSTTKQASPSIAALTGVEITDIKYKEVWGVPGQPPILVVTEVISAPTTYVAVTWEDWREGDADIYFTYSDDDGETFAEDARLNEDKPPNTTNHVDQLAPDVATSTWMKEIVITKPTQFGLAVGQARMPVTTMHIVWQDFRNSTNASMDNDPDIFYAAVTVEPDGNWPWPIMLTYEDEQQVNHNDLRAWQTAPVWQGEPSVAAKGSDWTLEESDGYNAFIAWADGRNYGGAFENLDVYFRVLTNIGESTFVLGNDLMLNDGARLHDFTLTDPYDKYYRRDMPPHARQRNPAIAATLMAEWPTIFGGYVYVVWDDDRIEDPFWDRNVYFARSNMMFGGHRRTYVAPPPPPGESPAPGEGERYGSGSFVSEIFDSRSPHTTWYMVDWHAVTDLGTYITLQTRMGSTPAQVLNSEWYPKRFPYPDDALSQGAPLQGYDAPGQHIEDAAGNYRPEARYIQYRVNFWARNAASTGVELNTPFLFDVILHYERNVLFLPLVARD